MPLLYQVSTSPSSQCSWLREAVDAFKDKGPSSVPAWFLRDVTKASNLVEALSLTILRRVIEKKAKSLCEFMASGACLTNNSSGGVSYWAFGLLLNNQWL